jgi:hypothetical protein
MFRSKSICDHISAHLCVIKIVCTPELTGSGLFARDESGVGDGLTARIRALEVVLYPFRRCVAKFTKPFEGGKATAQYTI